MVKYDYKCLVCVTKFEVDKHYGDNKLEKCPKCGSKQTRKIISAPSIQFHGDGFTLNKSEE